MHSRVIGSGTPKWAVVFSQPKWQTPHEQQLVMHPPSSCALTGMHMRLTACQQLMLALLCPCRFSHPKWQTLHEQELIAEGELTAWVLDKLHGYEITMVS